MHQPQRAQDAQEAARLAPSGARKLTMATRSAMEAMFSASRQGRRAPAVRVTNSTAATSPIVTSIAPIAGCRGRKEEG